MNMLQDIIMFYSTKELFCYKLRNWIDNYILKIDTFLKYLNSLFYKSNNTDEKRLELDFFLWVF